MKEKNKTVWSKFWEEEDGVGVIEIVLILVIIFTIYKGCK